MINRHPRNWALWIHFNIWLTGMHKRHTSYTPTMQIHFRSWFPLMENEYDFSAFSAILQSGCGIFCTLRVPRATLFQALHTTHIEFPSSRSNAWIFHYNVNEYWLLLLLFNPLGDFNEWIATGKLREFVSFTRYNANINITSAWFLCKHLKIREEYIVFSYSNCWNAKLKRGSLWKFLLHCAIIALQYHAKNRRDMIVGIDC